jgi:hypothetical protein
MPASRRVALISGAALVAGANAMGSEPNSEPQATALEGSYHPANVRQHSGIEGVAGVSIRLECAMRAMQGILAGDTQNVQTNGSIVKRAFQIADAMIAKEKEGK